MPATFHYQTAAAVAAGTDIFMTAPAPAQKPKGPTPTPQCVAPAMTAQERADADPHLGDVRQELLDDFIPSFLDELVMDRDSEAARPRSKSPVQWHHQLFDIPEVDDSTMLEEEAAAESHDGMLSRFYGTPTCRHVGSHHNLQHLYNRKTSRSGSVCSMVSLNSSRAESMLQQTPSLASSINSAITSPVKAPSPFHISPL